MNLKPLISIGLPVFNGEKYLREALTSILAQTYSNFELIISDNASTDRTEEICRVYADKDDRIKYYKNEKNVGAVKNFNRVFQLSSGEYFKWASHDDVIHPDFLYKCLKILEKNPTIVLCCSQTGIINGRGQLVGTYGYTKKIDSPRSHERFGSLLGFSHPMYAIFGLMRSQQLTMTHLTQSHIGSDRNLLAEIGLLGRIYEIPESLIFIRQHSRSYSHIYDNHHHLRAAWWDPIKTRKIEFTLNLIEYFKSVGHIQLNWFEKLLCYAHIVKWFILEGWPRIYEDMETLFLGRPIFWYLVSSVFESYNIKLTGSKFLKGR